MAARLKRKNESPPTSMPSRKTLKPSITSKFFTTEDSAESTRITVRSKKDISSENQYDILRDNPDEVIVNLQKKPQRLPPITMTNLTENEIHASMATLHVSKYRIKNAKIGIHIFIDEKNDFDKTLKNLKEANLINPDKKLEFYTHDTSDQRYKKIVLRGLRKMETKEIIENLKEKEIDFIADVKIIHPKEPRYKDHVNYILYLQPKGDIRKLTSIDALFKTAVKWDRYKNFKRGPVQCHNCQRPGHGSRNCFMPPRCLWCGKDHHTNDCPEYKKAANNSIQNVDASTGNRNITLIGKCCNCGEAHFANDERCKYRADYTKMRRSQANSNRTDVRRNSLAPENFNWTISGRRTYPNHTTINNYEPERQISFSEAVKQGMQPNSADTTPNVELFSFEEIITISRDLIQRLKTCRTKEDQILVLYEVTTKYLCDYGCK